jgi:hypothetical protein
MPYVTVTVCVPGTTNCTAIDHVLLDTGSFGLRVFSSALGSLPLPPHSINGSSAISECASFLNTYAWGSIKDADIIVGGKKAPAAALQVMITPAPAGKCATPLMAPPNVTRTTALSPLSANGILGVGRLAFDGQTYFDCANGTCSRIYPTANQQVQNPVTLFPSDNNGVVVQLPPLEANGNTAAQGYLIFGIATRSNNSLGSANIVQLDSSGFFTTRYKSQDYSDSFIDSGSNGLYFDDRSISSTCTSSSTGFYCPPSPTLLSATFATTTVNFSIASADALFASGRNYAFSSLGGWMNDPNPTLHLPISPYFDWGLPFFFGRTVYTVVEGKTVGAYTGPFYAFTK